MTVRSLRSVQRRLAAAVVGGARASVATLRIVRGPGLDAAQRVGVYAYAFGERLRTVMANDFPGVARFLGDRAFTDVVAAYVRAHPSRHPNLSRLGRAFPGFVRTWPGLRQAGFVTSLATLELAVTQAYDARAATPLGVASLAAAKGPAQMRLALQPSARLLAFPHAVVRWYDAFAAGRRLPAASRSPSWVCVHRIGWAVHRTPLTKEQFTVLSRIARGASLAASLRGVRAGGAVRQWFVDWVGLGLFVDGARTTSV